MKICVSLGFVSLFYFHVFDLNVMEGSHPKMDVFAKFSGLATSSFTTIHEINCEWEVFFFFSCMFMQSCVSLGFVPLFSFLDLNVVGDSHPNEGPLCKIRGTCNINWCHGGRIRKLLRECCRSLSKAVRHTRADV